MRPAHWPRLRLAKFMVTPSALQNRMRVNIDNAAQRRWSACLFGHPSVA
jgi:hypothetical protein